MTSEPQLYGLLRGSLLVSTAALALAAGTAFLRAQESSPSAQPSSAQRESTAQPPEKPQVGIPAALPRGKKLVLMDGSFQLVREYERTVDRVRYYSLERSASEEIPASLVDWPGTEKSEAEQDAQRKALAQKTKAAEATALAADLDVDKSLQVRPGVFLPDDKGFFALDGNLIVAMEQDKAVTRVDKGRALGKSSRESH